MNADQQRLNQITERIIGGAFTVTNTLGCGFLEKVYENALAHELQKTGLTVCLLLNFGHPKLEVRRIVHAF